jgi:hypothetical protein
MFQRNFLPLLSSWLFYPEEKVAIYFETLMPIYQTTRRHTPWDRNLSIHPRENFNSRILNSIQSQYLTARVYVPSLSLLDLLLDVYCPYTSVEAVAD